MNLDTEIQTISAMLIAPTVYMVKPNKLQS